MTIKEIKNSLLDSIVALESIMSWTPENVKNTFGISKDEAIKNSVTHIKRLTEKL